MAYLISTFSFCMSVKGCIFSAGSVLVPGIILQVLIWSVHSQRVILNTQLSDTQLVFSVIPPRVVFSHHKVATCWLPSRRTHFPLLYMRCLKQPKTGEIIFKRVDSCGTKDVIYVSLRPCGNTVSAITIAPVLMVPH